MKRMHIHVGVESLDQSIKFYTALFDAQPAKTKEDYAKWMLDDPFVNFAISTRPGKTGIDHLGLQVDDNAELEQVRDRLKNADMAVFDEGETTCCYARSEKSWVEDPTGIAWETYQSMEDTETYSLDTPTKRIACCVPEPKGVSAGHIPADKSAGECC